MTTISQLPKEINAPAAYPHMLSQLEGHQGYPQIITVEASVDSRGIGHEEALFGHELSELGVDEPAEISATFGETCKSEEGLSKGPRRIDQLGEGQNPGMNQELRGPQGTRYSNETKELLGNVRDRNDRPTSNFLPFSTYGIISLFRRVFASHAQEALRHSRRHGADTEAYVPIDTSSGRPK
ncbi:hypothetical protein V8E52_007182 [Russula decolorans]